MSDALRDLPLACPIDGLALSASGRTLVCERGHAYDISRFGYVNLLPVQFKPSKDPGDDAAMVAARRRVLDAGLFDPLADAVADRVLACLETGSRVSAGTSVSDDPPDERASESTALGRTSLLLDAGCGEGFYTARMAERLRSDHGGRNVRVLGTDISVHAVKAAARRHRDLGWAVANNTRLPVGPGAPDVITSLFGFETWEPWSALQDVGQYVVVVHAGARHLLELREAIYETVRIHDPPSDESAVTVGYAVTDERQLAFDATDVPPERLADVLAMTPHAHRSRRNAHASTPAERMRAGGSLTMNAVLRTYRRTI